LHIQIRPRRIAENEEHRSPGRDPCTRTLLLSIHNKKSFNALAKRSLQSPGAIRQFPMDPEKSVAERAQAPRYKHSTEADPAPSA
jgi:hypothetical protein